MTEDTRLIESAFPLRQVSRASVHEKSVRHGRVSTLHVWPARRPLAASRAAVLSALSGRGCARRISRWRTWLPCTMGASWLPMP